MKDINRYGQDQASGIERQTAQDDFWNIDMLLPKRRTPPPRAPQATETTEISFGEDAPPSSVFDSTEVADVPLNLNRPDGEVLVRHSVTSADANAAAMRETPVISYESETSLIHRVAVYAWSNQYRYYRDFCNDAVRYLSVTPQGEAPPDVPYFSYVPQYAQLNEAQLSCYFYWRREFRKGNAPKIDESYLYLYVYEILNTAGYETPAEEGLLLLYRLLRFYGKTYPKLLRSLSEWIVDYSLIFRLSVPEAERKDAGFWRLYASSLKEFYISSPGGSFAGYTDLLIRYCSAYDYKKSHFYKGGNCAYFDRFLPGALSAVIAQYSKGTHLFSGTGMGDSHMIRNAYEQALCSYRIRYRIEVDYASFSRSHEMRFLVSDVLKYAENRLRAFLGIKSRLTTYSLSTEVRKCIDRYCDENFPHKSAVSPQKKAEEPAYEKLYDLPKTPLSLSRAAEIERDSWETTARLTEAFSDASESASELPKAPSVPAAPEISEKADEIPSPAVPSETFEAKDTPSQIFGEFYPFVIAAYREDIALQRAFCAEKGMLPDLVADCINEIAADVYGDILLTDEGTYYAVIEEYRALLE